MSTARQPGERSFRSGECAADSGLYCCEHETRGCGRMLFVLLAGDEIPRCPTCDGEAWFTIVQAVPYIQEDPDFRK